MLGLNTKEKAFLWAPVSSICSHNTEGEMFQVQRMVSKDMAKLFPQDVLPMGHTELGVSPVARGTGCICAHPHEQDEGSSKIVGHHSPH